MSGHRARPILWAALLFIVCRPAAAQTPQPPPVNYFFPDAPTTSMIHDGDHFYIKPVFAWVGDYTAFSQNSSSVEQVGTQDNTRELRAGRVGIAIRSKDRLQAYFYSTLDYQESKTREDAVFQIYDLGGGMSFSGPTKVFVGKQKEPFSYELMALSVLLPQQERILLPFFVTRSIGITLSGLLANERMTWAVGAFNDWITESKPFKQTATDYTSRVTALVWEAPNKTRYVHVGAGYRSAGSDDGEMRFAGRPESNVADKFTDTGTFKASGARELSLEGLYAHGRFDVLTEHIGAWVNAPESQHPYFSGWYVAGSWRLTGEHRPYLRSGGQAFNVTPKRRLGAVELVGKYSHVDLTDGALDGGELDKWHFGVNWWASTQWKIGFSYGDADLTKGGLVGNTKMWLTRFQWLY